MSRNSKKYINIVTLTFDFEMQGQTWRNTFIMIFMFDMLFARGIWKLLLNLMFDFESLD